MSFIPIPALKKIMDIPLKEKLSEDDLGRRQGFIWGTIIGSEWECKTWLDFVEFNNRFRPRWVKLYERFRGSDGKEWPCFDKPGRLEFVGKRDLVTKSFGVVKQTVVNESLPFPNEYAEGPNEAASPGTADVE